MERIKIWVGGFNKDENKPIAFFKPLGREDMEKRLGKDDFMLIYNNRCPK